MTAPGAGSRPLPYRLVATDLDGTLLRSDNTVSRRSRDALAAVTAAGAAHIIVTGRSVPWTRHVLDDLGYQGLAVCGQGAQVYDAGAHRLLTSVTLDRRLAALALARIEAEVGPVALAAGRDGLEGEVLIGEGYVYSPELPVIHMRDTAELWAQPINKLYIQHRELGDDAPGQGRRGGGRATSSASSMAGEGIVELLPLGLTKATGLSLAARRLEGDARRRPSPSVTCPTTCRCSAGPGTAWRWRTRTPTCKAVADELTASNDEDGIAVVLERVFGPFRRPRTA